MGYLDETGLSRVWNRIKAYIQSLNYTSNIGTVTGITMNNTSYSPIDGDVDIGTVVTDVSGKANTADLATVATSGSYTDLDDKPTIPTVPTALSSFTDDLGSSPTHTHSQYLTSETEPDFNGSAAATITSSDISNWNGKTSNVGTITGITMNGASKGTSGVVDLGTVITEHQSLSNYVQKNQTSGLLKNDGTVDQNTYLTTETEPAYTQSAAATLTSNNIVKGASQSYIIWSGTQQEYDAITTKDNNTIYFIKES